MPQDGEKGRRHLRLGRRPALVAALRVAAVEDQLGDALGVEHGIGDGDRRALRDAEDGRAVHSRGFDDGFEVAHEGVERDIGHVAVGEPVAAPIVTDQPATLGQMLQQR
jgi:hypothetical protein